MSESPSTCELCRWLSDNLCHCSGSSYAPSSISARDAFTDLTADPSPQFPSHLSRLPRAHLHNSVFAGQQMREAPSSCVTVPGEAVVAYHDVDALTLLECCPPALSSLPFASYSYKRLLQGVPLSPCDQEMGLLSQDNGYLM